MSDDQSNGVTELGAIVEDREDSSPNPAVVINTPDLSIDEWNVPSGRTVADENPRYDHHEDVIIVLYKPDLNELYPYYSGVKPLDLSEISNSPTTHYGFPKSRLKGIGKIDAHEIPLSQIHPIPYHARNFNAAENSEFIKEIKDRGYPRPYPLLRVLDEDQFQILNGHKRIWVSSIIGLDRIPARCLYVDDWTAARTFITRHLPDYDTNERETAINRIRADWGEEAEQLLRDVG